MSRFGKIFACFLFFYMFVSNAKCDEGMCTAPVEGKAASCDDGKNNDLIVEDTKIHHIEENQDSKEFCTISGNEKKCGDSIVNESDKKSKYYSKKTNKSYKKQNSNIEYPSEAKYEELFLRKGHEEEEYKKSFEPGSNYTTYFDFSVSQEEIDYIKKEKMGMYSNQKFSKNYQGNFLHFYKIAYEKKLPVLFNTDSMLYAFNENLHKMTTIFLEDVYYFALKNFFEKLVQYGEQLKENPDNQKYYSLIANTQIYFGVSAEFLNSGFHKYEGPKDVDMYIKGAEKLAKKYYTNNFGIMMKSRFLNTQSLIPMGIWKRSKKLFNLYHVFKWYNLVKFDLRTEINSIYILGKMIVESGMTDIFNELRSMLGYFIGEDRRAPNFVEVYQIAQSVLNDNTIYQLNDKQIGEVSKIIDYKVERGVEFNMDLIFMNDYIFYSRESYEKYRHEKEDKSFLFTDSGSLQNWVINKLIEVKKQGPRIVVSSFELVDAMHHASSYRPWVFNRYKGKETFQGEKMMPFRDAIDLQDNFEKAKYSIKHSMEKEPQNWRKSIRNHYHYLLYKNTRRIKHSTDPVYSTNLYKEYNFYTAWGSYNHFLREILIMTIKVNNEAPKEEGGIPEVVIEPHLEFYREMQTFLSIYKNKLRQYILSCEYFLQINYKDITKSIMEKIDHFEEALNLIVSQIKLQAVGKLDEETKGKVNKLIYFDYETKTWKGWYANLFEKDTMFYLDVWMNVVANFPENKEIEFQGLMLNNIDKQVNMGLIVVEDEFEKTKKMVLYAKRNIKEFYNHPEQRPDLEMLSKDFMDRY